MLNFILKLRYVSFILTVLLLLSLALSFQLLTIILALFTFLYLFTDFLQRSRLYSIFLLALVIAAAIVSFHINHDFLSHLAVMLSLLHAVIFSFALFLDQPRYARSAREHARFKAQGNY
jgi:predicted membrane protein